MSINSRNMLLLIFLYGVLSILNGCASISSQIVCGKSHLAREKLCDEKISLGDGIVYYLPKRFIRVNVAVTESNEGAMDLQSKVCANLEPSQNVSIDSQFVVKRCEIKKKVIVTVVNNSVTETIPDPDHVFLLRYNKNYIGENNMAIGVNNYGLLSVTHADTINKINEITANIAIDVAAISVGSGFSPQTDAAARSALPSTNITSPGLVSAPTDSATFLTVDDKCKIGSYTLLFDPADPKKSGPETVCDIKIELDPVFNRENQHQDSYRIAPATFQDEFYNFLTSAKSGLDIVHLHSKFSSLPGLFYKQDLPYLVTVQQTLSAEENNNHVAAPVSRFLTLSPNESKIYFAPVTETLFTDNTSDITLINGVVNTLKENTDSELLALTKIPSNVLGAYTEALGKIGSSVGKVLNNQNTNQTTELSVLLGAEKIKRCQLAIAINNTTGKTGDALTTAFNNIQTACGN